jgi:hypothetical protein
MTEKNFKAKHHEHDTYRVGNNSVVVFQKMYSGNVTETFLTKEAIEELYEATRNNKE